RGRRASRGTGDRGRVAGGGGRAPGRPCAQPMARSGIGAARGGGAEDREQQRRRRGTEGVRPQPFREAGDHGTQQENTSAEPFDLVYACPTSRAPHATPEIVAQAATRGWRPTCTSTTRPWAM